jgi:hypothetical protein
VKHAISRIMMKNDCPVQTLRGSPSGQHSEHHHVAIKDNKGNLVMSITYDDQTGLVEFAGYGERRATHVTGMREMDFAPEPAKPKSAA